jgi:hypothetical protein
MRPPGVPQAILNFFAHQPDYPAIAGDMSEEFHQRAQQLGPRAARRWFWGEVIRNAWALTARELMRTPLRTTIIAIGCWVAVNLITDLYGAIIFYLFQFHSPLELVADLVADPTQRGIVLALQFFAPLVIGGIGARLLPGREWALALTYTLVFSCLFAAAEIWYVYAGAGIVLTRELLETAIIGNALRQVAFWMGCLWFRSSSRASRLPVKQ